MNNLATDRSFESIRVGETVSREHLITDELIMRFASLSGDHNPLHTDSSYAASTEFGTTVAHGMLLGAFVSELVGMELPGARCLLMKESLEFKKPVFANDAIVVTGTVLHKSVATSILEIAISIMRGADIVAAGTVHTKVITPVPNVHE